ncbi:MAG: hypothetical protein K8I30_10035 [Anaerolineae bacterium]|nr:hypothetical protein [Anaerolineae bacterium]
MVARRQIIEARVRDFVTRFRARLRASFMLRWVLANAAGWSAGLYLGVWSISPVTLCLGGAITGICLGWAQWWALKVPHPLAHSPFDGEEEADFEASPITVGRDWIGLTAAGALVGALPAKGIGLVVSLGWGLGIALVGAIFGAGVGLAQWYILTRGMRRAGWWIAANAAGGGLCALLTLAPILRGLPIGLLLGTALYGYLTGRALLWLTGHALNVES